MRDVEIQKGIYLTLKQQYELVKIEEVQQAKSAGFVTVNLGKRILRAETAGLAMAMAAMYEFGELGN